MDGNPLQESEVKPDELEGTAEAEGTEGQPPEAPIPGEKAKVVREHSAIDFPYIDLEQAMAVPEAIHKTFGTKCLSEQLSGALDVKGGAFARRHGGARMFGLIEKDGEYFKITELGRRIINADYTAAARVEAFRNVALYERLYEDFRGTSLPADAGIENHIKELGVPAKQTETARQIFRRSARQAGFFPFGEERLIMPAIKEGPSVTNGNPENKGNGQNPPPSGSGEGNGPPNEEVEALRRTVEELRRQLQEKPAPRAEIPTLPVAVTGVLTLLPLNDGDTWTDADLSEWMTMFRGVIRRSFKDRIDAPVKEQASHG